MRKSQRNRKMFHSIDTIDNQERAWSIQHSNEEVGRKRLPPLWKMRQSITGEGSYFLPKEKTSKMKRKEVEDIYISLEEEFTHMCPV